MNKSILSHKIFHLFLTLCLCYYTNANAQDTPPANADNVKFLTEGVTVLPQCGIPGPIVTLTNKAFPVVVGEYEEGVSQPVVAAAFVEKGRVVGFGHTDYCNVKTIESTADATTFFNNVVFWCAGKKQKNAKAAESIRVAVWHDPQTADFLKQQGFQAASVNSIPQNFDVFIAGAVALSDKDYETLLKNVHNGAGFITCGLGWGWSQLNPGKSLVKDHAGNRNFTKFNVPLQWTHGNLNATDENGYKVENSENSRVFAKFVSVGEAFEFLKNNTPQSVQDAVNSLDPLQRRQLSSTIILSYRYMWKSQQDFCDSLITKISKTLIPTIKTPIKADDVLNRLVVAIQTERYINAQSTGDYPVESVPAFSAANDFPGPVPEDSKRLKNVKVPVKTSVPAWASTGLYAVPGEIITVKVEPKLFAQFPKPFKVRIGVHSDKLWHFSNWVRYPEITIEKTITSSETKIVNPFGGLIYIDVPKGIASHGLGVIEFEISGAVSVPYFIKNVTSLEAWKTIRNNPAPWAELQGDEVIVTVPSEVIRQLDDPQALMETWDKILILEAELASGPYYREKPERITCDREISAGYMHSGYPVMTHMDVERVLVDNDRLKAKGDWGFFHEFGHNHQSSMWTFDGSGEVTVNYFTLYIMEKLCGLKPGQARIDLSTEQRIKMLTQYLANGSSFEQWKQDPFLALNMTVQLVEEFGWEPIIRSISEYKKAPYVELPKNDLQKRDQWMVRLSRNTNKNLGPFFEKWGVPTSQEARDSIKGLPVWISSDFDEIK